MMPEPQIAKSDFVKVRVLATSICGTDYHIYRWDRWSAGRVKPPRIMGHEFAGEIVEVGADVTHLKGGRLRQRRKSLDVRTLQAMPAQRAARLRQYPKFWAWTWTAVLRRMSWFRRAASGKTTAPFPPYLACIQDPLGNAVHATLAGEIIGRSVAVLGCGPIGIFAVAVAKAAGASDRIYATDTKPYRLDLAKQLGATAVAQRRRKRRGKIHRGADGRAGRGRGAGNVGRSARRFGRPCESRGAAGAFP